LVLLEGENSVLKKIIEKSIARSPWVYHMNTGSCNGCDIELLALFTPRYDVERFGVKLTGTPRQADIILVTGPMTLQARDRALRVYSQVPRPNVVVAVGACPQSCNVFKNSYAVVGPVSRHIPVDVNISGCPPRPEAIIDGIIRALEVLKKRRVITP
jgi:membrane-bound hydrogenase subunit mbhJ